MKIKTDNEWDKLNTVIVGVASTHGTRFPIDDPIFSQQAITTTWEDAPLPQGNFPDEVITSASEDLRDLTKLLQSFGVDVRHPMKIDASVECSTYDWTTDGMYSYCPRDLLLVVDDKVIEAPMVYRSRQFETRAYENIKRDAMEDNAIWFSAPKPALLPKDVSVRKGEIVLTEEYPIFDAANVCRLGDDLLYLVSSTGNHRGGEWLQQMLPNKTVHIIDNLYSYAHIDSTVVPLREGLVLLNGSRVNEDNYPKMFKDWERVYIQSDDIIAQYFHEYPYASKWIAMNMLVVEPGCVIMESGQPMLRAKLIKHGIDVHETPMRMARTLGGGAHCCTLDLNRG